MFFFFFGGGGGGGVGECDRKLLLRTLQGYMSVCYLFFIFFLGGGG